ncbi:MAG: FAD-dependent oxidoreductase [Rhizobiaceae bacterium]|nr:FAD-dependent oxidoreductase [Rhizobiaceae bacterium]
MTDVAIIGAGISGLTTAYELESAGIEYRIFEANSLVGGRVRSIRDSQDQTVLADLGPTWVWPRYQPVVKRWIEQLNLKLHDQYETGMGVYEESANHPVQHLPFPGQQGIARISGGPQAIVDRLADKIPMERIELGSAVTHIQRSADAYTLTLNNNPSAQLSARRIVVSCPLRIALQIEGLSELLPVEVAELMQSVPTWMAVQAKISIVYDRAFWREAGLSGRVASRIGPLMEMHDISGEDGTPAALFGFRGVLPHLREHETLKSAVLDQLERCFGEEARKPKALEIMDWAKQGYICSEADLSGDMSHPQQLPNQIRTPFQDGTLLLSVAETASSDPGLIAGALSAGENVAKHIIRG